MTRSAARELAVHISFQLGINPVKAEEVLETLFEPEYYSTLGSEYELYAEYPDEKSLQYINRLALGMDEHLFELDSYIEKYSKSWKLGRISRTAVAIMRTAMFEILYIQDIPNAAAINEAVELAKKYEENSTVSFINGILGSFVRQEFSEN